MENSIEDYQKSSKTVEQKAEIKIDDKKINFKDAKDF